jgi:hypothetical protein
MVEIVGLRSERFGFPIQFGNQHHGLPCRRQNFSVSKSRARSLSLAALGFYQLSKNLPVPPLKCAWATARCAGES